MVEKVFCFYSTLENYDPPRVFFNSKLSWFWLDSLGTVYVSGTEKHRCGFSKLCTWICIHVGPYVERGWIHIFIWYWCLCDQAVCAQGWWDDGSMCKQKLSLPLGSTNLANFTFSTKIQL
uniref:Uncharacterized protein n=1 Tax=Pyxicephalus adspersus TaxID=30357 RepID=A0AAV2ZZF5_PYXAD|nr:TPA: hypothetical protein GDO54_011722 [Pyxicephalus adspersus]